MGSLPKLTLVALTIYLVAPSCARFTCPPTSGFPCSCFELDDDDFRIHCSTNSATNSAFDLTIYPDSWVRIQCENSPRWSDFLLGASIQVGAVERVTFTACASLGYYDKEKLAAQLGVTSTNEVQFESVTGALSAADVSVFPGAGRLILRNNRLGRLNPDFIKDLPRLYSLELSSANVQLSMGLFDKASSLKALELSNNRLKFINPGTFDGLRSIELLNLWKNEFADLDANAFRQLDTLITLDIHCNDLRTLPADIFADLASLQVINFGENNFTRLPERLFRRNSQLKIVKLSFNKINMTTLPERFYSSLPELRQVTMTRMGLLNLPENLFWESRSLSELKMNRNYLTSLPEHFFKDAFNLRALDLSFNDLQSLPDELFANARKMVELDLSRNHLTSVNDKLFANMHMLEQLNLEDNDLVEIHVDAFRSLDDLKIAKFAYNELNLRTHLFDVFGQVSPFNYCQSLEELDLSHNNVAEMFSDWMIITNQLRRLDLSYNKFEFLQSEDLQFMSKTIHIDLSHNSIDEIDLNRLEFISANQNSIHEISVDISANPIYCGCGVYSLLRYLNSEMQPHAMKFAEFRLDNLRCDGPDYMENAQLVELRSNEFRCRINNDEPSTRADDPCSLNSRCSCWLRPADRTLIVDCAGKNLTEAPKWVDAADVQFVELNLAGNLLEYAPRMDGEGLEKVTSLNLTDNKVRVVNESLFTEDLKVLNLDGNNLTTINVKALEKLSNVSKLTLGNNPWQCNCSSRDLLSFVQSNAFNILDRSRVVCVETNVSLSDVDLTMLCPLSDDLLVVLSMIVSCFAIVLGCLIALYYRFRLEINIWLYSKNLCLCLMSEDDMDSDKIYDAFVSFSHKDEDFVMKQIVSRLEEGPKPYKLCIHVRDWLAGEWIPNQIVRSVDESRRTIVVISPNFIESVWGMMEFQTAHRQAVEENRCRVIVIVYGDIGPIDNLQPELKAYLQMNTYIKWGEPWFWKKLMYAMPHKVERAVLENLNNKNNNNNGGNSNGKVVGDGIKAMQEVQFVFENEKDNVSLGIKSQVDVEDAQV